MFFADNEVHQESLEFLELLLEFVDADFSVSEGLSAISRSFRVKKIIASGAYELLLSLKNGTSFYFALKGSSFFRFPEWALSFVEMAEKHGNLKITLHYLLEVLKKQKSDKERFLCALLYPISVALLAFAGGTVVSKAFYGMGAVAVDCSLYRTAGGGAFDSLWRSGLCLFCGYLFLFAMMKKILRVPVSVLLFDSLGFMVENSVPILEAVDCCFSLVCKNTGFSKILSDVKQNLLKGERASESFAKGFYDAGLKNEAYLLEMNLKTDEVVSASKGFRKTAEIILRKHKKASELFLAVEQPVLLFMTAIFLVFILKDTFVPFITGFGGQL